MRLLFLMPTVLVAVVFQLPVFAQADKPELLPPMQAKLDTSSSNSQDRATSFSSVKTNAGPISVENKKLAVEYLRHGAKLHREGSTSISERFFNKAINLDPSNPDGYYNLGAMYESRGDRDLALAHYRMGLEVAPNDKDLQEACLFLSQKIDNGEEISSYLDSNLLSHQSTKGVGADNRASRPLNQGLLSSMPSTAPLLAATPKSSPIGGSRSKALLGMFVRASLNIGIRAAVRSIGSSGGLGF